ncbi:unnamed protein product [Paramecium octaurelia]|uniref:Uncharacterized protein n=1 Tax=Paramecium octaurelia TaxID=43137 RepID=A0A8S1VMR0_PAROT|nr:unnamed protein product [Paramecium octaurelia]
MQQYNWQQHLKQQERQFTNNQFEFHNVKDLQMNMSEKRTSKQNFQCIFDNIIILLKELKNRQQKIQSYVQDEIIDMNQKLDNASKQLLSAIEQFQQGEKEENHLMSTLNSSKQNFFKQQSQNPTNNKEIVQIKLQQQDSNPTSSNSFKLIASKNVTQNLQIKPPSQNLMKSNLMQVYQNTQYGNQFEQTKNMNKQAQNPISEKTQDQSANVWVPRTFMSSEKAKNTTNLDKIIITEENLDNSLLKTQNANQSSCLYCSGACYSEFISTPCYHNYHDQCLREYYKLLLQTYNQNKKLVCICNMKMPQLFISRSLKINLNSLLEIQIEIIRGKITNQIDWCVKCKFFWIRRYSDTYTKQCRMCDQNGVILIKSK